MSAGGLIVVTGASGHTGVRLVKDLVEKGKQVRAITRDPSLIPLDVRKRMEIVRADLTREEEAREAVKNAVAVIAMTHIRLAPFLIHAMKAEGVSRGIFMSSTRRFTRFPEETARAVISGEEAVMQSGLRWTIIRASMIYGGKRDNNITHLVRWLETFPIHPLPNGGKMLWQPVFTWDVVAAIEAALERDVSIGKAYTIAGPEPISYKEMVETILRLLGKRRLLIPVPVSWLRLVALLLAKVMSHPPVRVDQIDRLLEDKVFDISDARRDLGFDPIPFEEGIRRKLRGEA